VCKRCIAVLKMECRIILPKQGLQMKEGTIVKWFKAEGDSVKAGEPLFEMETDKINLTIDAAASGTLKKIIRAEGDTVPVGEVIALLGDVVFE
jgi:pyruvate/2-oxoglutarate dehydrogenase complex dihydrolipoamide acyltransferase (E2) component